MISSDTTAAYPAICADDDACGFGNTAMVLAEQKMILRLFAAQLQRWLVESDDATDTQAYIISPESSVELARAIIGCNSHFHAGVAVARKAVDLLRSAHEEGGLRVAPNEVIWFDTLQDTLDDLPESESEFIGQQLALADLSRFLPEEYGLEG